ncbi:hypothetical protein BZG36_03663 [Bifiguratus adelaidae]|uniref:Cyclase n=1 Tax=Bifiguratus adelaidae TaxID=1938954 RepID=A0A261XZU1_9FUNG|nr:hypothetical protein BZG36_03663 [Bifiguratus adelaidae]
MSIHIFTTVVKFSPIPPLFGCAAGGVKVKNFSDQGFPLANDDIYLDMNTQASTQWDGLLHVGNTKAGTFYNGVKGPNAVGHLGIHHMARRGITARAILLDWKAYADANNIEYDYRTYKVTLQDLNNVIAADKIAIKPGDILMIRTGWIEWYETADEATCKELASTHAPTCLGVDPSEDILEWIWDSQFAAVSADCPSFEVYPPTTRFIHEDLLGSFGCPIGEFFDLQRLAKRLKQLGRHACLLTSAPLNRFGGVASPANVTAVI